MKKYDPFDIRSLTINEFNKLIAFELNKAGFKNRIRKNGDIYECSYEPDEHMLDLSVTNDISAINYLKVIGLLDNGKCPRCGYSMPTNIYSFTCSHPPFSSFSICKDCYNGGLQMQRMSSPKVIPVIKEIISNSQVVADIKDGVGCSGVIFWTIVILGVFALIGLLINLIAG